LPNSQAISCPFAIHAGDLADNIYVADTGNHAVRLVSAGGAGTVIAGLSGTPGDAAAPGVTVPGAAARCRSPAGVAVGASGTMYVADTGKHVIRAITPRAPWNVTTIAGLNGEAAWADGSVAAARFNAPRGLDDDAVATGADALYIADTGNSLVRRLDFGAMTVTTIAGRPGATPSHGFLDATGTNAWFDHPRDVASDASGVLYIADTGNAAIRRILLDKAVTTLAPVTAAGDGADGGAGDASGDSKDPKGGGAPSPFFLMALPVLAFVRYFINKKQ
jgi:hypothetical protein